jgi:hypothetical protein
VTKAGHIVEWPTKVLPVGELNSLSNALGFKSIGPILSER